MEMFVRGNVCLRECLFVQTDVQTDERLFVRVKERRKSRLYTSRTEAAVTKT